MPKYRGSSPIQWCLVNGESKTGVTIMRTALAVDSGDILLQKEIDILPEENAGELFDRLAILGGQAIVEALEIIADGRAVYTPQQESQATHYPMISKEDGKIDWSKSAREVFNKMRGFTPWPSAFTTLDGKLFKILKCVVSDKIFDGKEGEVVIEERKAYVVCGNGTVELKEVQLEGKKAMPVSDFLLSGKLKTGVMLG